MFLPPGPQQKWAAVTADTMGGYLRRSLESVCEGRCESHGEAGYEIISFLTFETGLTVLFALAVNLWGRELLLPQPPE